MDLLYIALGVGFFAHIRTESGVGHRLVPDT